MKLIIDSICFILFLIESCRSFTLEIDFPENSKNLIEYIYDGREDSTKHDEIKLIMFLELIGTGQKKTTLANYLKEKTLICTKKYKIDWVENVTLTDGFKIGHENQSETLYPASYTPPNSDFTYIDNLGFIDNRDIASEKSNGFFRNQVIKNAESLKFILLLTQEGISELRDQLAESIKAFTNLFGIFNDNDTKSLSKTIGIIITRFDNNYENDSKIKNHFKKELLSILENDEMFKNGKNKNKKLVLEDILNKDQLEVVSNPKKTFEIDKFQSDIVKKLINRLEYIKQSDAKIRTRIDNFYISEFEVFHISFYNNLFEALNENIKSSVLNYYDNEIKKVINVRGYTEMFRILKNLSVESEKEYEFETYVKIISNAILSQKEIDAFVFNCSIIKFYLELLPTDYGVYLSMSSRWNDQENILLDIMDKLTKLFELEFLKFENSVETSIMERSLEHFKKSVDRAIYIEDIRSIAAYYTHLKTINKLSDFDTLINDSRNDLLIESEKNRLLNENELLNLFIEELSEEKKKKFKTENWFSEKFNSQINSFIVELKQYENEPTVDVTESSFVYRGHFGNMSSILAKINNNLKITNLTNVRIYTTHSFVFDVNYKILKERYKTHSPNLIIISPKVNIRNSLQVDLSCDHVLGYPDNRQKAENGNPGNDGKPGLPGYNAGNLIIFADEILSKNNLKFTAQGGQGGPGQEGLYFKSKLKLQFELYFFICRRKWLRWIGWP